MPTRMVVVIKFDREVFKLYPMFLPSRMDVHH